jgi:hypothetical protein
MAGRIRQWFRKRFWPAQKQTPPETAPEQQRTQIDQTKIPSGLPTIRPARPGSLDKLLSKSQEKPKIEKTKRQPEKPVQKEVMPWDKIARDPKRDLHEETKPKDRLALDRIRDTIGADREALKAFELRHDKAKRQTDAIARIGQKNPVFLSAVKEHLEKVNPTTGAKPSIDPQQIFRKMTWETFLSSDAVQGEGYGVPIWNQAYALAARIANQQKIAGAKSEQINNAVANGLAVFFAEMIRTGKWPIDWGKRSQPR